MLTDINSFVIYEKSLKTVFYLYTVKNKNNFNIIFIDLIQKKNIKEAS